MKNNTYNLAKKDALRDTQIEDEVKSLTKHYQQIGIKQYKATAILVANFKLPKED